MVTQKTNKSQVHTSPPKSKVMRSYQVVLRCDDQLQREEINKRIKDLEKMQNKLLSKDIVKQAIELYRTDPREKFFTRKLGKVISKNPNIAESAFHWLHIAIKGKIDKEYKVQGLIEFLQKNPLQMIEWLIFGRSPYTEISLHKYWKLKRRYVINLLTSTRSQTDSFWRKYEKYSYFSNRLQLNGLLPNCTQQEILQALDDSLFYYNHEVSLSSQLTKNQKAFVKKLKLLKKEQSSVIPFLTSWINSPQSSRWKSLRNLSEQLASIIEKPNRKLFSALRLLVVFKLFDKYMMSVSQLIKALPPTAIVPLPFKRKKKEKLPIKLLMKKDYVIIRQGNAQQLTEQIKKHGYTDFSFPKRGKKKLTAKVLFPSKIVDYLHKGANIRVFQIISGKAPSFKPKVDVVLEGPHSSFHSSKLLHNYLNQIPGRTKSILGVDINRLREYMVRFNTDIPLTKDLITLAEKYSLLSEKTLPELNRGLMRKRKLHDTRGCCKLKGELKRVHTRRNRILREITRLLPHFLAAVIAKKKCKVLKIENLTVDPAGKKGALAKAIFTMPDNLFIYKKAVWLASLELGYNVQLEVVSAQNTSTMHHRCGGVLDRQLGQYDIAPCKKCGKQVNTHDNAAQNIASLAGTSLIHDSFPLTHVRGTT